MYVRPKANNFIRIADLINDGSSFQQQFGYMYFRLLTFVAHLWLGRYQCLGDNFISSAARKCVMEYVARAAGTIIVISL